MSFAVTAVVIFNFWEETVSILPVQHLHQQCNNTLIWRGGGTMYEN